MSWKGRTIQVIDLERIQLTLTTKKKPGATGGLDFCENSKHEILLNPAFGKLIFKNISLS